MKKKPRVVIVCDGEHWFIRRLVAIHHDLDTDTKNYHCDKHLGGPYESVEEAVQALRSPRRPARG